MLNCDKEAGTLVERVPNSANTTSTLLTPETRTFLTMGTSLEVRADPPAMEEKEKVW